MGTKYKKKVFKFMYMFYIYIYVCVFSPHSADSIFTSADILMLKGNEYTYTHSRETNLLKLFLPPFWKVVYSEKKSFAPLWSKIFPFRVNPFLEGDYIHKSKQESTEIVSVVKMEENPPSVSRFCGSNT